MTLRCVIVDDSPALLRAATKLLESEGVAVVGVAATGDEALRLMEELQPDLMLIDIDLAGESGFEVVRRVEGVRGEGRAPSILISAHDQTEFGALIAASPALGFLPKWNLSAAAIRRLLARAQDERS
jgi:CheY-like chemotaxis protein